MKYVIASTAVTDEIHFADGESVKTVMGGAGLYALCGIKLWCDDVTLVTGVGKDFKGIYGKWFRDNNLSEDGLIIKDERTPQNVIRYFTNGEREEIPCYGPDHYKKIETVPEDLKPYFETAKGIYIFKNSESDFWEKIIEYKKKSETKLMWEIACDAAYVKNYEKVKEIAKYTDIFSVNLSESGSLTGKENLEDIIKCYRDFDIPLVFLRRGAEGAVMITKDETVYVPAISGINVVDPTGGGNSSSGAVLYGFCEGFSAKTCGIMGSISAAMCLSQYGAPEKITAAMRTEALNNLALIMKDGE